MNSFIGQHGIGHGNGLAVGHYNRNYLWLCLYQGVMKFRDVVGNWIGWTPVDTPTTFWADADLWLPKNVAYDDKVIYILSGDAGTRYLYRSSMYVGFSPFVDVTPDIAGIKYGGAITASGKIHSSCIVGNQTYVQYLAMLGYATGDNNTPYLLISHDAGLSWVIRYTFSTVALMGTRSLRMHPFNYQNLFVMGNLTQGSILVSIDEGVTWSDKVGNWDIVFGTIDPNHGGGIVLYSGEGGLIFPIFPVA
jgi:hypothetical protein